MSYDYLNKEGDNGPRGDSPADGRARVSVMLAVALAWIGGLLSKCTEFAGSKADTRSERDFWAVLQTLAEVGVIQGGAFLLIATLTIWLMHNAGNHERGRIVPLFLFTLILLSLLGVFSVNISLGKH